MEFSWLPAKLLVFPAEILSMASLPHLPPPLPAATGNRSASPRKGFFWMFQGLFWLLITILSVGMSQGVAPGRPIAWLPIAIRMASGFAITAVVYQLFELPWLRGLNRLTRWPLLAILTIGLLVGSLVLLLETDISPGMIWTADRPRG